MYLTINPACVLNWHLRILAIRPVPGGWRGPVPLRSRSGSYCRLPHQVGLEDIGICILHLNLHLDLHLHLHLHGFAFLCVLCDCAYIYFSLFFSFYIVHRWVPTLKRPGRSQ